MKRHKLRLNPTEIEDFIKFVTEFFEERRKVAYEKCGIPKEIFEESGIPKSAF